MLEAMRHNGFVQGPLLRGALSPESDVKDKPFWLKPFWLKFQDSLSFVCFV